MIGINKLLGLFKKENELIDLLDIKMVELGFDLVEDGKKVEYEYLGHYKHKIILTENNKFTYSAIRTKKRADNSVKYNSFMLTRDNVDVTTLVKLLDEVEEEFESRE